MSDSYIFAEGRFEPNWESLQQYSCPEWFRDAKFGIWAHWGPQSAPMAGDWYARNMYMEGSAQYEHHLKQYGHPSEFGYKDIIPLWKAEKFDPEFLMRKFVTAGAKYFTAMGVHHDNFDCWNSTHHRWNAVNYGPKKDIVGTWCRVAREHGLRFGVTEHLGRTLSWFSTNKGADKEGDRAGVPYDGNDPVYEELYLPPHGDTSLAYPRNPTEAWKEEWFARVKDLVDQYQPDLLYTDGAVPFGEVGRRLIAHLYNSNEAAHSGNLEAIYTLKDMRSLDAERDLIHGDYVEGIGVRDVERGVIDRIWPTPWQTDTSIGDWFYRTGDQYKSAGTVIHMLIDIVSKNGNLLLNVPQRPDGTYDDEVGAVLDGLSVWMGENGEAIYGTSPWQIYGEGSSGGSAEGHFGEGSMAYGPEDIRFTVKDGVLYAMVLGMPEGEVVVRSLASGGHTVRSVSLLGAEVGLEFEQEADGLRVTLPERIPESAALALKVVAEKPFGD